MWQKAVLHNYPANGQPKCLFTSRILHPYITPLSSFLSSLSLLRLHWLRRRFVRIVPTDQIPHDFRRNCNSKLVNQLSKYTLKFLSFGKVSHYFRKILSKAVFPTLGLINSLSSGSVKKSYFFSNLYSGSDSYYLYIGKAFSTPLC